MDPPPSNIDYIKGEKNGPCVVIMGSIHGDERMGEAVIAKLLNEMKPEKLHGDLVLILGNPAAYAANRRFIECDLNRLFGANFAAIMKSPLSSLNSEEKRALEIAPYLQNADCLLDIHSTIKPSMPFIYCKKTKSHLKLANLFSAQYIVSATSECRIHDLTSCADSYVNRNGGIGITYETGWHKEPAKFSDIMKKIYLFLQTVGSLEPDNHFSAGLTKPSTQVEIYDCVVPKTANFHFEKDFANFDIIKKDEVFAEDRKKPFKAKETSFIIFPKTDIVPDAPACYLGRKINH